MRSMERRKTFGFAILFCILQFCLENALKTVRGIRGGSMVEYLSGIRFECRMNHGSVNIKYKVC